MGVVTKVWPQGKRAPRDLLKKSGAFHQALCMNCQFVGHGWGACKCGSELIGLNGKVKAPKKGDKKGWKQLLIAYAWLIHNRIGEEFPCPELEQWKSQNALATRESWEAREKILTEWVLKVDAHFAKLRNKK